MFERPKIPKENITNLTKIHTLRVNYNLNSESEFRILKMHESSTRTPDCFNKKSYRRYKEVSLSGVYIHEYSYYINSSYYVRNL